MRDARFNTMLSEVPWMKFKVIAEPDYSIFARDPVVKEMMARIARSTVEHVTAEMNQHIKVAVESATEVVMASAMQHVAEQMQAIVQSATMVGTAQRSTTALGGLHVI
jgi:glycerol dehydrogenase-like iron-containing ADH family enzyme